MILGVQKTKPESRVPSEVTGEPVGGLYTSEVQYQVVAVSLGSVAKPRTLSCHWGMGCREGSSPWVCPWAEKCGSGVKLRMEGSRLWFSGVWKMGRGVQSTYRADCPRQAGLLSPGWGPSPGLQGLVCAASSLRGR